MTDDNNTPVLALREARIHARLGVLAALLAALATSIGTYIAYKAYAYAANTQPSISDQNVNGAIIYPQQDAQTPREVTVREKTNNLAEENERWIDEVVVTREQFASSAIPRPSEPPSDESAAQASLPAPHPAHKQTLSKSKPVETTDSSGAIKQCIPTVSNSCLAESESNATTKTPSIPTKEPKLVHVADSYKAIVSSANYDKSTREMTIFVDFIDTYKGYVTPAFSAWAKNSQDICLSALSDPETVTATNKKGFSWKFTRILRLKEGRALRVFNEHHPNQDELPNVESVNATWSRIAVGESHRLGVVFVPTRQDNLLTLDINIELAFARHGSACGVNMSTKRINLVFDGISPTVD